jgi:hypothetical protein
MNQLYRRTTATVFFLLFCTLTLYSQEPEITISGDISLKHYEPGKTYNIYIQASSSNEEEVTLAVEHMGLREEEYTFTPSLPLTGKGVVNTHLRIRVEDFHQRSESVYFIATDASNRTSESSLGIQISRPIEVYAPEEPVIICINQPFDLSFDYTEAEGIHTYLEGNEPYYDIPPFGEAGLFDYTGIRASHEDEFAREEDIGTYKLNISIFDYDLGEGAGATITIKVVDCSKETWAWDVDGDGYGGEIYNNKYHYSKDGRPSLVNNSLDCDDNDKAVGAPEIVWFADEDGDGFGGQNEILACDQPEGYVNNFDDCNDNDPSINPDAEDSPYDNIDSNCDGIDPIGSDSDGDGVDDMYDNCPDTYNHEQEDSDDDGVGDACDDDSGENQAPVITLSGDYGIGTYVVGQEYTINVEVLDPEAEDGLILTLGASDINTLDLSFNPSLPLSGNATLTTALSFTPSRQYSAPQGLSLVATDAVGSSTTFVWEPEVTEKPVFLIPDEPIVIGINQPFQFTIPVLNPGDYIGLEWDIQDMGFGINFPDEVALYSDGNEPTERHVGTYRIPIYSVDVASDIITTDTLTLIVYADCVNKEWYRDNDKDGYGTGNTPVQITCSTWEGYAENNNDCNDNNAAINPTAPELPGDNIDNNCNGQVDEGGTNTTAPVFISSDVGQEILVGEQFNFIIQVADPTLGDGVTLRVDSAIMINYGSNGPPYALLPDLAGATFNPGRSVTAPDTASMHMTWTPTREHLGEIFFFFSATDQHGNSVWGFIPFVVDLPFELQPVSPIVVGTQQPLEIIIPISNSDWHQLDEVSLLDGAPSWLQAELISVDGRDVPNAIRVWGTPPAKSFGTYKPLVRARTFWAKWDTLELQIRVGNCTNRTWYADADGDGFGADETMLTACWQPEGYVNKGGDCDDWNAAVYPAAPEIAGDGLDNNCDGMVDETENSCYATRVVSFTQGPRADNRGVIDPLRSIPLRALGAPQEDKHHSFVSLGFGGELVLELGSNLYDDGSTDADLMVVETTWGWAHRPCYDGKGAGTLETMMLHVSANGEDWVQVSGNFCRNVKVDLSPVVGKGMLPYVRYIKITDTSNPADFNRSGNGYDVDGIITCRELFEDMPTNSRTAGKGFDPNFFYEALEDEEGTRQPLSYYPNPVKDMLTIRTADFEDENLQVEVYSLAGVLLYKAEHRAETGTGELQVDLQHLRQGVYVLRLQGEHQQQTLKISKE